MSSKHRLKRLRDLLDQLERLPASDERERMLREVRVRVVDIDTGETPRAMLPVDMESMLAADPGPPTIHARSAVVRAPADEGRRPRTVRPPAPANPVYVAPREAVSRAAVERALEGASFTGTGDRPPMVAADVLSLDDSPSFSPRREAHTGLAAAPWTRGLRG